MKLDNSKLGSTQQQKICWHCHGVRIISSQKIYGLYAWKHHKVEMRGDVTDAWRPNNEQLKIGLLSQWKLEAVSRKSQEAMDIFRISLSPPPFPHLQTLNGFFSTKTAYQRLETFCKKTWRSLFWRKLSFSVETHQFWCEVITFGGKFWHIVIFSSSKIGSVVLGKPPQKLWNGVEPPPPHGKCP